MNPFEDDDYSTDYFVCTECGEVFENADMSPDYEAVCCECGERLESEEIA